MFGRDFNLHDDEMILAVNSPKNFVKGPYVVVYKDYSEEERWVIVALEWQNTPFLGIRWFSENNGNPTSRGHATWFLIPSMLTNVVLNGLPLNFQFRKILNQFLAGKISGEKLKKGGEK